ncbi:VolA/Pla-1 family phospholipase [Thalassotalea atypica]|uniref:VolA/Pla-1 family phospholipase n=1 Tax=Thalassotalea atypica TaxID=2054316 RepID=UPI002573C7BB|nr:VolA/Pla-1 family phospholipase [Thalassotalea atypica]
MNKLILSLAIAGALGLSGCDSESIKDVQKDVDQNGPATTLTARVVFDPSNGVLSVPNDLLFVDTTDGTLNPPVADATDFSDPNVAVSALDGWSTVNPFKIALSFPAGTSLEPNSVSSGVRIFEVEMGGPTASEACSVVPQGAACRVIGELAFGADFFAQASGNDVAVVPTKPLKAKTTYIVVLTNGLTDNNGKSVAGSTTYELVQQDLATLPLGSESQRSLQGAINSFEAAVGSAGVDKSSIIYTMAMTTQSTVDALGSVKSLMAQGLQMGSIPAIGVQDSGISVADVFASQGVQLTPELAGVYGTANYLAGSITLPYYLGVPTAENPMAPVNDWWKALCDSGAILAGLAAQNPAAIPTDPVSVTDATCIAVSQAAGLAPPGLRDLSSVMELDPERNLTKFNPVPAQRAMMTLDVQMTTPDVNVANVVRASLGMSAIAEPAAGWPVVILQHGITSKKEDMLAITGSLSMNGFATVAIDHPLHGSRGFDLTGDGIDEINASTVSATHYMNLASLLTTRDNLRQSTSDMLGLRLGVNFLSGTHVDASPVKIDSSKVHFLGHSLGAITGINFIAMANSPLAPTVDPLFSITSNSLAMPGVTVANFLMESAAFGDVIKSGLTYQALPEFQAFVGQLYPDGASEAELVGAYLQFYSALSAEQQADLNATFASFTFAAQTVTDSGDPVNYAGIMAATQTPTHLIEVIGNGSDNLSDQVIPNVVSTTSLSGTEAAITLLDLPSVSTTSEGSGAVRFINGHHSSILSPSAQPSSPDPLLSAAATQEMQTQVTTFFASLGQLISVTNSVVVQ